MKLTVIAPHFSPDVAPTGEVLSSIVHHLVEDGHRLHVVTARNNRSEDWLPNFRELLRRREHRPTAVIFGSDDLAVNGFRIISELKLEIPRDLSMISTNDTLAPPAVPVPLTTMRFDYTELGMLSTRLLLRMIADPQAEHSTVIMPGELIARESTAKVASK